MKFAEEYFFFTLCLSKVHPSATRLCLFVCLILGCYKVASVLPANWWGHAEKGSSSHRFVLLLL